MFRTMYNNTIGVIPIPSGDKYRVITKVLQPYEEDTSGNCINKSRFTKTVPDTDSNGVVKKLDIQAQINSYRDSVRIETILRSLNANNQPKIVFDPELPVEDLTVLPKSIGEAKAAYDMLPGLNKSLQDLQSKVEHIENVSLSNDDIVALKALLNNGGNKNE